MKEVKVKGYAEYICPLTSALVTIPFESLYDMVDGNIPLDAFSEQALLEVLSGFASFLLEQDTEAETCGSFVKSDN